MSDNLLSRKRRDKYNRPAAEQRYQSEEDIAENLNDLDSEMGEEIASVGTSTSTRQIL